MENTILQFQLDFKKKSDESGLSNRLSNIDDKNFEISIRNKA